MESTVMNTTAPAQPPGGIMLQNERLAKAVDTLQKDLADLESRLDPVMRPEPPIEANGQELVPAMCPVADRISESASSLERVSNRIRIIIERVAL